MTRREAREAVFGLLFESEFRMDETADSIYQSSTANREIPDDLYVRTVYFGVMEHCAKIDSVIEAHAKGWSVARMSRVSRTVLRLATYEMLHMREAVPLRVSINEAIELSKKFDSDKAKGFINGILNAIKNEILSASDAAKTEDEGAEATEDNG